MIADAVLSPGHDGQAVLVLRVRHGNGVTDSVTLDAARASRLLDTCGAASPEELRGQPWKRLLDALEPERTR